MNEFLLRKQCDESNPKFRREYLGEWCADNDELMYKAPSIVSSVEYDTNTWRTVIGIDIGFNDETAMTVVGWKYNNPKAYVLTSVGKSGMSVSDIAHMLIQLKDKYRPSTIVMDPAGASKTLMEEFSRKYRIFIESAKKQDKAHYVEILNDALLNKELLFVNSETTQLQYEMRKLVWNEERTREREGIKCDRVDATLYAYRAALHYLEKIEVVKPFDALQQSKDMEQQAIKAYIRKQESKIEDPTYNDLAHFVGED
jgi:hypothetical protein